MSFFREGEEPTAGTQETNSRDTGNNPITNSERDAQGKRI